ncbi:hypothetical protein H8E52_01215 [bacterium]|nr:hypothetical protein [bacterium]
MKIAVACEGSLPEDSISMVMARCASFQILDTESGNLESKPNLLKDGEHGTGVKVAQWLLEEGVTLVVSGKVGPQAQKVFDEAGMKTLALKDGRASDILSKLRKDFDS